MIQRNKRSNLRVLGEGEAEWKIAPTSMHDDVLLDSEETHKQETDCADADVDSLVGSLESTRSGNMAAEVPSGLGRY